MLEDKKNSIMAKKKIKTSQTLPPTWGAGEGLSLADAARQFVEAIGERRVFAFYGKMGAGKTTCTGREHPCRQHPWKR